MKTQIMQKVLPCYLTPEELQTESQVLVGLLQKKSALEDEKKSTNSMYTERIKTVEEKIESQMPIVQYGRVDRLVDIKVEFHTPDKNLKQLTRLDTQTIIEICPMSNDELEDLFINAEEPQETTAETAPVEEPAEDNACEQTENICTYCGAINTRSGNKILHIFGNKPVCRICLAEKNEKYFNQVLSWDNKGHQVLFRPAFGFGCTEIAYDTTCFRFMGSGHSWGSPVYKEGDYETPGTEAADFYAELTNKENFKED